MKKSIRRDQIPTDRRPLGYWLRAIDGPLRENMREAFAAYGVTRREWRTLTTLHVCPASAAEVEAALPPRRARATSDPTAASMPGARTASTAPSSNCSTASSRADGRRSTAAATR